MMEDRPYNITILLANILISLRKLARECFLFILRK